MKKNISEIREKVWNTERNSEKVRFVSWAIAFIHFQRWFCHCNTDATKANSIQIILRIELIILTLHFAMLLILSVKKVISKAAS